MNWVHAIFSWTSMTKRNLPYLIRIALPIFFLLFINYAHCQVNYDSLRKYSYFIIGFKDVGGSKLAPGSGTGYFLRKESKLFFITAKHVICPCDYKDTCKPSIKRELYPDLMEIYLTNNNGMFNYSSFPVYIKLYRDTCKCIWPPIHPDLIAYEVPSLLTDSVYTLDKFINISLPEKKGSISIYGYPANEYIIQGSFKEQNSSHLFIDNYKLYNNYKYKNCEGTYSIDKQDYIISTKDILIDKTFGYSGSPVFIFDKKNKQWIFMGTFTATVEDGKLQFIKPEFSIAAINHAIDIK